MFHDSFWVVSRKFQEYFEGVLRVSPGSLNGALRKFKGCCREVTWMFFKSKEASKFQGCFKEVSRTFQQSLKGVSQKFPGCFKKVSSMFQESFKGFSRMFQGTFKDV